MVLGGSAAGPGESSVPFSGKQRGAHSVFLSQCGISVPCTVQEKRVAGLHPGDHCHGVPSYRII